MTVNALCLFFTNRIHKHSYIIDCDLLSIQNGVDSHITSVGVDRKYANRWLVSTRPC